MTTTTFTLKFPFDFGGHRQTKLELRRPKLRDLKMYARENDKDPFSAMQKVLASLCEVPEVVIDELDLEDFGPIKKAFEDFLNLMAPDSPTS